MFDETTASSSSTNTVMVVSLLGEQRRQHCRLLFEFEGDGDFKLVPSSVVEVTPPMARRRRAATYIAFSREDEEGLAMMTFRTTAACAIEGEKRLYL